MLENLRIGQGFDFHRFDLSKKNVILGGVLIPCEKGILAHSDGDIILHALMDAILGAMGLEDIGVLFPDNNTLFKDIDSSLLLKKVLEKMKENHYRFINVDISLLAEIPKIKPYREAIKNNLAMLLGLKKELIGLKATTTEKMGAIGREEGLACAVSVLLVKENLASSLEQNSIEEQEIEVFTDGACIGNPGPGGWASIIRFPNGEETILSGGEQNTTNNKMELLAILETLIYLEQKNITNPKIYTDSQYVQKGMNEWLTLWKKNGFKTQNKEAVAHADIWKTIDSLNQKVKARFFWVKAHNAHPDNERCDTLARQEARKRE